jgi:peroxiredoxin Q/BCP
VLNPAARNASLLRPLPAAKSKMRLLGELCRRSMRRSANGWGADTTTFSRKAKEMLGEGDRLPAVTLLDDGGNTVTTTDLLGGPLVLYFYPKDDTPGCTSEASQFRDEYQRFAEKGAGIVGVSRDSVESHQRFKKKYSIPFTLLADTESKLYKALGVSARSTFLIGEDGVILKVWPKVNVNDHAEEVLASLP